MGSRRYPVLLLVPFEPESAHVLDSAVRQGVGAHLDLPLRQAFTELEAHLGHRFTEPPSFDGQPLSYGAHRTLTAVALATQLEAAGIGWRVLDPGRRELFEWKTLLAGAGRPTVVGISTTFLSSRPWLEALIALVRQTFPHAKVALGGYYYTTDVEGFLSLDADVLCIGEGERRLPELVRAVEAGRALEDIPGLYVRRTDGSLRYSGPAPALDLGALPAPDWTLSSRIEPPTDFADVAYFGLETQRGCAFKCAFCTYRTLAAPSALSPRVAADRIFDLPRGRHVELYDATATSPKKRWRELCALLAEPGRVSLPLGAFARTSDIDPEIAAVMARAGVRHLYIGQESGDQQLLNLMRKGTRIDQVAPTIEMLGRHGLTVTLGLIHGFPGETRESLAATRALLAGVNGADRARPTVFSYTLALFALQDFAAVSQDPIFREDQRHFLAYQLEGSSVPEMCREILRTIVFTGRHPHAPVSHQVFQRALALPTSTISVSGARAEIFRWAKALERGVGIFLERLLDGTPPDSAELARIAAVTLEPYRPGARARHASRLRSTLEGRLLDRVRREWEHESTRGIGWLTRAAVAVALFSPRALPPRPLRRPGADAQAKQLLASVDRRYKRLPILGKA